MNGIKKEELKAAFICYLLAVFIFYIGLYFPPILIALPFVLAYSVTKGGYVVGGSAAALSLITGYFLNIYMAYILAAAFLPVAFGAGYAVRSKRRMFHSVIITSGAAFSGVILAMLLVSSLSGLSIIDYMVNSFGASLKSQDSSVTLALYQIVRYPDVLTGVITQEAVNAASASNAISALQDILKDTLNESLVSMIGIYSLLGGLIYYIVPRAIAKSNRMNVARIPAFSDYQLPKYFWLAFGLSYLTALIGESAGIKSFVVLEPTIYAIYTFVFSVLALCFLDFIYKRRGMGMAARVLLHVVTVLIFGYLLALLGLFENILNLRKHMYERQE